MAHFRATRSGELKRVSACIMALRQMFDAPQVMIDIATRRGVPVNQRFIAAKLDIVICTTRGRHLLARLPLPSGSFLHQPTEADPLLLGFRMPRSLAREDRRL